MKAKHMHFLGMVRVWMFFWLAAGGGFAVTVFGAVATAPVVTIKSPASKASVLIPLESYFVSDSPFGGVLSHEVHLAHNVVNPSPIGGVGVTPPFPGGGSPRGWYYQAVSNAVVNVAGTVKANLVVTGVWCQVNGAGWVSATPVVGSLTNWSVALNAQAAGLLYAQNPPAVPSTNAYTIQAYAVDAQGNVSATAAVNFNAVASDYLTVSTNGAGGITPALNGTLIPLGQKETLKAVPAAGYVFSGWSSGGSVVTSAASFSFTMALGTSLTANFNQRPVITSQPVSQSGLVGDGVVFGVTAAGDGLLSYQWQFNGKNLSGQTGPVLSLPDVTSAEAGSYRVVVSSPYGSATSQTATLTVYAPPSIVTQPQSSTVKAGKTASVEVVATGTGPLTYEWFFVSPQFPFTETNRLIENPAGGTNFGSLLTIPKVSGLNNEGYCVVVTNLYGSVTSSVANLTVDGPPVYTGPTTNTPKLYLFTGEYTSIVDWFDGVGPMSYQWQFQGANLAGQTNYFLQFFPAQLTNTGEYRLVAANSYGQAVSGNVDVIVTNIPASLAGLSATASVFLQTNSSVFWLSFGSNTFSQFSLDGSSDSGVGTYTYIPPVVTNGIQYVTAGRLTLQYLAPEPVATESQLVVPLYFHGAYNAEFGTPPMPTNLVPVIPVTNILPLIPPVFIGSTNTLSYGNLSEEAVLIFLEAERAAAGVADTGTVSSITPPTPLAPLVQASDTISPVSTGTGADPKLASEILVTNWGMINFVAPPSVAYVPTTWSGRALSLTPFGSRQTSVYALSGTNFTETFVDVGGVSPDLAVSGHYSASKWSPVGAVFLLNNVVIPNDVPPDYLQLQFTNGAAGYFELDVTNTVEGGFSITHGNFTWK